MNKNVKIFLISVAIVTSGLLLISWRQKASNLASRYIDVAEIGTNQGFSNATFEKMMKDVGWKGGEAWCMYFVKAIYLKAFPHRALDIVKVLTGSTQTSWENAKKNPDIFKVITDGLPRKGDIIIWQNVNNPSTGHAGIAFQKQGGLFDFSNPYWNTIEGNTNLEKAREGQGVMKQTRNLIPGTIEGSLKLLGFLRLKTSLF